MTSPCMSYDKKVLRFISSSDVKIQRIRVLIPKLLPSSEHVILISVVNILQTKNGFVLSDKNICSHHRADSLNFDLTHTHRRTQRVKTQKTQFISYIVMDQAVKDSQTQAKVEKTRAQAHKRGQSNRTPLRKMTTLPQAT